MISVHTALAGNASSGTFFYPPNGSLGGQGWNATENNGELVIPVAGTIDRFFINVNTAPGGSDSRAFTFRKNTADASVTATISAAATSASDTSNSFSVAAGDTISLKQIVSATAANAGQIRWAFRYTSSNTSEFPIMWSCNAIVASGTVYGPVQGVAPTNATETNVESVMPTAGTLSKMYVNLSTATTVGTWIITLFVNGVSTALTCTVGIGAATANDTTHSVSVNAGDTISYQIISAATNSPRPRIGMLFAPTTDGEGVILLPAVVTVAQAQTDFNAGAAAGAWGGVESNRTSLLLASTLKKLYARVAGPIANGQTVAILVRVNSASTTITATATGDGTNIIAVNDTTHTATTSDADTTDFRVITSATTGTVTPTIGLVVFVQPAAGGGTADSGGFFSFFY